MDIAYVEWDDDALSVVVLHVDPFVPKQLDVVVGH